MSFFIESPLQDFLSRPSRRSLLKTLLAAVSSLMLPSVRASKEGRNSFWFLHTSTGESWAVDDPVAWCLDNAHKPILERARNRLVTLDADDPQRVIRLATRRCKLNLLEIQPRRVFVHYWGQEGCGDLRLFFKQHLLARKDTQVILMDRKKESSTVQSGDDFLYGERLVPFWPWRTYVRKWQRRDLDEHDDWTAAPRTWSGFAWEGVQPNRIPWAALKSAWRRTAPLLCPNCDQPSILTNFGRPWSGMFNRYPQFLHVCQQCRRMFKDESIGNVQEWMVMNLDAEVWPDYEMIWDRRRKWEPNDRGSLVNLGLAVFFKSLESQRVFSALIGKRANGELLTL